MTLENYAAAAHLVDAGHVQVSLEGIGTSVVDAILSARGVRRRIVLVLPSSAGIPFVVAATIWSRPCRVESQRPAADVECAHLTPPFPDVEVSPRMFWHRRSHTEPLQMWLRAAIRDIAASIEPVGLPLDPEASSISTNTPRPLPKSSLKRQKPTSLV